MNLSRSNVNDDVFIVRLFIYLHYVTLRYVTLHYITLQENELEF